MLLILDLGVFHRTPHKVSFREAAVWSTIWISLAFLFNVGLYVYASSKFASDPRLLAIPGFEPAIAAKQVALEFLTGFLVEKSLAIDNIFVFAVVFSYFAVPPKYQHKILFYGIIGALFFRAIFIALGSVLMQYHAVIIGFGIFLIFTGIKLLFQPESHKDLSKNPIIRWLKKMLPLTDSYESGKFWIRKQGVLYGTPMLVALVIVELSDIIFAVDSVPAIFALTKEPLIVFTSNIFAILGLRSMYFMIGGVLDKFHLLKYGLGLVLVFVGLKMTWLNGAFGGKFPITWSLGIIALLIGGSIVLSLLIPPRNRPDSDTTNLPQ